MRKSKLYKGFSTQEYENNKSFALHDVELVKRDILNHIFTRRGERVMLTQFGTRIPDLLFEPLDQEAIDIVTEDLEQVVLFEPRVTLRSMEVIPLFDENAIVAALDLNYIELDLNDIFDLKLVFEQ